MSTPFPITKLLPPFRNLLKQYSTSGPKPVLIFYCGITNDQKCSDFKQHSYSSKVAVGQESKLG